MISYIFAFLFPSLLTATKKSSVPGLSNKISYVIKKQQQKRKITATILHNYNIHLEWKDYKRALPYTRGHVILNPKLSDVLFRTLGMKNQIGKDDDSILIIPSRSKYSSEVFYRERNFSVTIVFIRFIWNGVYLICLQKLFQSYRWTKIPLFGFPYNT